MSLGQFACRFGVEGLRSGQPVWSCFGALYSAGEQSASKVFQKNQRALLQFLQCGIRVQGLLHIFPDRSYTQVATNRGRQSCPQTLWSSLQGPFQNKGPLRNPNMRLDHPQTTTPSASHEASKIEPPSEIGDPNQSS